MLTILLVVIYLRNILTLTLPLCSDKSSRTAKNESKLPRYITWSCEELECCRVIKRSNNKAKSWSEPPGIPLMRT